MKKILALLVLISMACLSSAQPPDVLAKAAFLRAQELYGNAEYQLAIEKLKQTQTYLNSTNPRIDHLLTICYVQASDPAGARAAVKSYFELASDTDPNYMQMLGIIDEVEQLENALVMQKKEDDFWNQTLQTNTRTAYQNYLKTYPKGKYAAIAQSKNIEQGKYQVTTRSADLPARLGFGEYSYIFGSPDNMLTDGEINLTFERKSRFYGSAIGIRIFVNDVEYTKVKNGSSETISVPAGKLIIYMLNNNFENYSKILFYPTSRNEKFIIDLRGAISEYLQHSSTYDFNQNEEKSGFLDEK